jgi:hypothetical protein
MDVTRFLYVSLGSDTVQFHDSLGSRRACAYSEAGFSSQNGDMLKECTAEEQCFFCTFCGQKNLMQRVLIKKCFLFTTGSVCRVKRFTSKRFAVDEEVETEVRKWLRQQSKDFYAAGFDALVKR